MFQNKKLKRNATSAIAEVTKVALLIVLCPSLQLAKSLFKSMTYRLPFLGPISMQLQHEIGKIIAKHTNGKIKVKIIQSTLKLIRFFESKKIKRYNVGQMWSITFIARATATTLVRLPKIC